MKNTLDAFNNGLNEPDTCAFIGSGGRWLPTCCNTALRGRAYCETHLFEVYKEGTARARRYKDERVAASVYDIQSEFNLAIEELEAEGFDCYGDSERSEAVPDING